MSAPPLSAASTALDSAAGRRYNNRMRIIDMHCDTILKCLCENTKLKTSDGHINAEKLKAGGSLAQCFAIYLPTNAELEGYGLTEKDPWKLYKQMLSCYEDNMKDCADLIRKAYSAADIRANASAGFISSVLTVEDGVLVDGKLQRLEEMYSDGVRMLALTWNYENSIGFPNAEGEAHFKGLKPLGFEAIELMNRLGMIIDVSHLSEGGFYDVAKNSGKPFVASHSCSRALCNHRRNLTDDQLRAIGDTGSMVGVNFCGAFLRENQEHSYVEDIVKHMKYMVNLAGIESVGWGSDFDGIARTILEIGDYSGMELLQRALEKEFSPAELDKINHDNFLRVFEAQE